MEKSTRLFISYSHDSEAHRAAVLALTQQLRHRGIDAWIDHFESFPEKGWPVWMETEIKRADFVLLVCTPTYQIRFEQQATGGAGKGAAYEGLIISQELYQAYGANKKFIPVVLERAALKSVPMTLRHYNNYVLSEEKGFDALYRLLTRQPEVVPVPVGNIVPKPVNHGERRDPIALEPVKPQKRVKLGNGPRLKPAQLVKPVNPQNRIRPSWATDFGADQYGEYAEFTINNLVRRLRWIPPGEFWMGSPKDEAERESDEMRHRVVITQGYWLAETACDQALWQAVMGENPSEFKGDDRPIENVSWKQVQKFCQQLNQPLSGLEARLPTEAEWEYGCRAGRETAFWWGDSLSTAAANYDGNHPYNKGDKGEYRRQTVAVKQFSANPWGL